MTEPQQVPGSELVRNTPLGTLLSASVGVTESMGDLAFHQGLVLAWDQVSNVNRVLVAGAQVDNIPVLSAGAVMIAAGDVVGILRVRTQYFILGRISNTSQSLQIRAAYDTAAGFTVAPTYSDLNSTSGPTLNNVYIGPSRRCLVFISVGASASDEGYAAAHFLVTGASNIPPPSGGGAASAGAYIGSEGVGVGADTTQVSSSATRIFLLTELDGLQTGLNNFMVKYLGINDAGGVPTNNDTFFFDRTIVVLPL